MKSIKVKLIACIAGFVLVSLAMVTSTLITVSKQAGDTQVINTAGKQRMLTQKMVKEFYIYFSDAGEDDEALKIKVETLQGTINLFDTTLNGLIDGNAEMQLPPTENTEILEQLLVTKELWLKFAEVFKRGFEEGFYDEDEAFLNSNNIQLLKEMNAAVILISNASKEKVALLEQLQYLFLVISILIGVVIFAYARQTILLKLDRIVAKVNKIAEERNLTERVETSQDEIGELAKGFNFFLDEFQALLQSVVQAATSVTDSSSNLSSASMTLANDANQQQLQIDQMATAAEEMSATIQEVAANSTQASDFAAEASKVAEKGGKTVTQTIEGIGRIAASVDDSTKTITALGDSSDKIGQIVSVIEDIAAQTNLLALNAAIEAARAGEQGRGFAVVADEVRHLAERTSNATKEIAGMISTIQSDTQSAVASMTNGTTQVESGVTLAHEAGESLQKIAHAIVNVADMVQQIATATEEQAVVANDISRNASDVAGISTNTAEVSNQSFQDSQVLVAQADELQQRVSAFKL